MSPLKIRYSSHFSLIVALLLQSFGFSSNHYSYDLELVITISEIHALFQTHIVQYDNRFDNSIVFQVTQNRISLCHLQRQTNHHRIYKRDNYSICIIDDPVGIRSDDQIEGVDEG